MANIFLVTRPPAVWEVIVPILFGVWFFAVARPAAASAVKWNSRLWGFSGTRRQYEISFRIAGFLLVIFGVLVLLRVI
jgi:hypothetical protein